MKAASRRDSGEPAGRGPISTWRRSSRKAASPSKRSTLGAGVDSPFAASSPTNGRLSVATRATRVRPTATCTASTMPNSFTEPIVPGSLRSRGAAGTQGPPERDRRVVLASGKAVFTHARGRAGRVRGAAARTRGFLRSPGGAPRPRAALSPEARLPAARDGPAVLGRRPDLQPRLPRAAYRPAEARQRRPASPARGADLLPAARSLEAALGNMDRAGPRGRPLRADLEDAPRARGWRLGRGHRNRPVRPVAAAGRARGRGPLDAGPRALGHRARGRGRGGPGSHAVQPRRPCARRSSAPRRDDRSDTRGG